MNDDMTTTVGAMAGKWCILRTSAGRTLGVAKALADAGFEVWTPSEMQLRRAPRSRTKRERMIPLIPTFVFARADRLTDLIALSKKPSQNYQYWDAEERRMMARGVPYFSVFRHLDRYPLITDASLEALRQAEQRMKGKPRTGTSVPVPVFELGTQVRVPEGSFAGMIGVVEESKGEYTLVCFPKWSVPIKIASLLLLADMAEEPSPKGTAARAA
jgi:hypothetical protein